MNKYLLCLIALLGLGIISCNKEDSSSEIVVEPKLLTPVITITQGDNNVELSQVLHNGVIHLETGKNYHISVLFPESVSIEKGDFLKFKSYSNQEYFADFYGTNSNPIVEKVTFTKEGFQPYSLEVQQNGVIAENIYLAKAYNFHFKNLLGKNVLRLDEDKKTLWVIQGVNPNQTTYFGLDAGEIYANVSFLSGVFIEPGKQEQVTVQPTQSAREYNLTVSMVNGSSLSFTHDTSVVIPVYKRENNEKGEKLFDVTVKGDFAPYIQQYYHNYSTGSNSFNTIKLFEGVTSNEISQISFHSMGTATTAYIDNVNSELVSSHKFVPQKNATSWTITLKEDKMAEIGTTPIHLFDVWEGEKNSSGTATKKANAQKREIFISR